MVASCGPLPLKLLVGGEAKGHSASNGSARPEGSAGLPHPVELNVLHVAVATLTHDEWAAIEEACEVLQPYEEVTVEISGEGQGLRKGVLQHPQHPYFPRYLEWVESESALKERG
ncbi:unnamed protein product [Boreogadus saida]